MASDYGVIAFLQPPVLKGVTQPDLITFETEYTAYKEKVNSVNTERAANDQMKMATIRDCMDGPTLHALCLMKQIEGATKLEEATDQKVQDWFEKRQEAAPFDMSERIASVLATIKYEQLPADPAGAALKFCLDAVKSLDKNNASEIIHEAEIAKYFLDRLENKIEPPILKERLKMKRTTWTKAEKADFSFFQEEIAKLAVDVHQNEIARTRVHGSGRKAAGSGVSSHAKNKIDRGEVSKRNDAATKGKQQDGGDSGSGQSKGRSKRKAAKEWESTCLNPECNELHRLRDCTSTSEARKKELYDEFYAKKREKNARVKVFRKGDAEMQEVDNSRCNRYDVSMESVPASAMGDSGSDVSVIDDELMKQVMAEAEKGPSLRIKVEPLVKPISFEMACLDGNKVTCRKRVKLAITIQLPHSHVPVRLRNVDFYISDSPVGEVLLGRPFLDAIGIETNLTKHLANVRDLVHDQDINDIPAPAEMHKVAALRTAAQGDYRGMSYSVGGVDDDPIEESPEELSSGLKPESAEDIHKACDKMLGEARSNGISSGGLKKLRGMLGKYEDVLRTKIGPDPPAKIPPLSVQLETNARPFKTPQRRYAPAQATFINNTIKDLERVGAVFRNPSAKWASPALAVPKPGTDTFRFTVDLRGVNARTVTVQSAMPHLESKMQELSGSRVFAKFDFSNGYWQIKLAEESQECMSIQTPNGVYTPRRILQGGSDSGNHFQAGVEPKFQERLDNLIMWIDDSLLHAKTEVELLEAIEVFLATCDELGLKVHANKTTLFAREIDFCGRRVTPEGVQFHPRHYESLMHMQEPTRADQLQQFICACNWMRTAVPDYAARIAPLHSLMETCYQQAGKRTKASVRKIDLSGQWGAIHAKAFQDIKQQLVGAVKLAHPKPGFSLCLFSDASDSHWGSVLTQVPEYQMSQALADQNHEPLCFLSGAFSGSAARWSVPEKEGFAIVESMLRLDYLIMGKSVNIFTDHANLVYLYDPYGRNPSMPRHTANKLMRWALKLSVFRYVIEHLPGSENVWADMLTRWAVQEPRKVKVSTLRRMKRFVMLAPIEQGKGVLSDPPSRADIIVSQRDGAKSEQVPGIFKPTDGVWRTSGGVIWIPEKDKKMQLRILIAAHAGIGGHRGRAVTQAAVQSVFSWTNMFADVNEFVSSCFHCISSKDSSGTVPRVLGSMLHAVEPNKLLHFDYCYMSQGENDYTYLLVLKDDHSGYVWLVPTKSATAEVTCDELMKWFAAFGVVERWVSDRGSHFRNQLVKELSDRLGAQHHFTLAYSPWSNGSVEVVNREVLRSCRALLSEFKLPQKAWPTIVPVVQSALNNAVLKRLGDRCPQTVFTGLEQTTPLTAAVARWYKQPEVVKTMTEVRVKQRLKIEELKRALDGMHKEVAAKASRKRKQAIVSHNRRTGVHEVNFTEGDFVLKGVLKRDKGRKPSLRWKGPMRVVGCLSDFIFRVEDLLTGHKEDVHGRRLKFFRNSSFEVSEEVKEHLQYQENELLVVENFDDVRQTDDGVELLVKWRGFSDEETDWVSLESLRADVPVMVKEALAEFLKTGTPRQRRLIQTI